jgi:hypothetical protein
VVFGLQGPPAETCPPRGKRAVFCGVGDKLAKHHTDRLTGLGAQYDFWTANRCFMKRGASSRRGNSVSEYAAPSAMAQEFVSTPAI